MTLFSSSSLQVAPPSCDLKSPLALGAFSPVAPRAERPALAPEIPHSGVERLRILAIEGDHRAARREVLSREDLRPGLAAVGGLEHAAFVAVGPELSGRAGVHGVGGRRVDEDLDDPLGAREADVRPVLAAVDGLVDPVADRDAVARPGLARSDPDDLRIRRVDRDGADRLHGLLVEDGLVSRAAVDRLPDAAGGRSDEDRQAIAVAHGVDRRDAAAHRGRSDVAGAEAGDRFGIDRDGGGRRRGGLRVRREGGGEKERSDGGDFRLHGGPHFAAPAVGAGGWNRASSSGTLASMRSKTTLARLELPFAPVSKE